MQALEAEHPVHELLLVQSRHPKQEVAIGLLSEAQQMRSTIQGEEGWLGSADVSAESDRHRQVIKSFPAQFFAAFPQAAERLLPSVFDQAQSAKRAALTAAADMELDTVLDNEFFGGSEDDFGAYVRCFAAMKRLWRV